MEMGTPSKGFIPPSPMFLRTPARLLQLSHSQDTSATPTRALISQTERAIQHYLKDDCETNLPIIRKLEDISYQLWVESNTAFLHESTALSDDEGWQWDEDCFIDSGFSSTSQTTLEQIVEKDEGLSVLDSSGSSIGSSIRQCDETDCYMGYLGCSELDDTGMSESYLSHTNDTSLLEDWVVVQEDCPLQTEEKCPLSKTNIEQAKEEFSVKNRRQSKSCEIRDSKKNRRLRKAHRRLSKQEAQENVEKSSEMYESDNNTGTESEDWTILSMRILEVSRKIHDESLNQSLDSGIKSPGTRHSRSSEKTKHFSQQRENWRTFCFRKALISMIKYIVTFRPNSVKDDVKKLCNDCCKLGIKDVIGLLHDILIEVYGSYL